jgi:hypothetical protein
MKTWPPRFKRKASARKALERERTWMAKNVDDPLVISIQTRIDLQVGGFSPRVYDSGDPGLISVAFPS